MDRGLKERLIGAAVLVALGVWLIPWVLDGPELDAGPEPQALQLPANTDPTPLRTQTIELARPREGPSSPVTPASGPTASVAEAPAVANESTPTPATATPIGAVAELRDEPPLAPEGEWLVQLGSFSDEENARRLADRAATYGLKAQVSTFIARGGELHRVRVGPGNTRERAEEVAASLSAHGFVAQVVTAD